MNTETVDLNTGEVIDTSMTITQLPKTHALAYNIAAMIDELQTTDDAELIAAYESYIEEHAPELEGLILEMLAKRSDLLMTVPGIDAEIARLQTRKAAMLIRAARLESGVFKYVESVNKKRIVFDLITIGYDEGKKAVEIEAGTVLPDQYMRQPKTPDKEPDKVLLKSAIEGGAVIKGVKIVQHKKLVIK